MWIGARTLAAIIHLGIAGLGSLVVCAQTITNSPTIALRSGESAELEGLFWVVNCESVLKSTPEAEVLDGPPGVSVAVNAAMVTARAQRCPNPVPGGMLVITAGNIEDASYTTLAIRITYRGQDGDRKPSLIYNLMLIP
jgi:hypothetical protein